MTKVRQDNVILEFIRHGRFVKVTAIDVFTHEEVSIIGDARHLQSHLSQLAVRKLRHMQSKR